MIAARIGIYIALLIAILGVPVWVQLNGGDLRLLVESVMAPTLGTSEFSLLEQMQLLILVFVAMLCLLSARAQNDHPALAIFLFAVALTALIRELDLFLDVYLIDHAWQVMVALLVAATITYCLRRRRSLRIAWVRYKPQTPLMLMAIALAVLLVAASIIGHTPFWQSLLGDNYNRVAKIAAEEMIELIGYWLWLIGAIEYFYRGLAYRRTHGASERRNENRRKLK